MWVEKMFSIIFNYWKSHCFSGDLELGACLPLQRTEHPHHFFQPTAWRGGSASLDIWPLPALMSNSVLLLTCSVSELQCRIALPEGTCFSLWESGAGIFCKVSVQSSPACCLSCPFEKTAVPIPGSVQSQRTFCSMLCWAAMGSTVLCCLHEDAAAGPWCSPAGALEAERRMAACPVCGLGAESWVVTPAREGNHKTINPAEQNVHTVRGGVS